VSVPGKNICKFFVSFSDSQCTSHKEKSFSYLPIFH
jgi:hypothetical protein